MAFDAYFPHITLPKGKTDYRMGDGIAMICAGQVMLVDGFQGGQPTDGLKAWLSQNKVKDIDIAVLTHPHWDHYNGLLQIEEDSRFHIKLVYMYDPLTLKHGCDGSANGRSVKEDMDNAYKWIRAMQAHGTRVLWIDKGSTVKFGDITWKIFREQPTHFTEEDQGNGWAFVNNGSLCLYSPETELIFPGDGPDDQERMMDYFGGEVSGTDVTHHMGSWTQHNAKALKRRGCVVAFGSCVEKNGPGTSGWTQYGGRRIKEEGIPLWGQEADIYIHADNGTITFRQGDKTISKSIPYHREIKEGWVKNTTGWWYRYKDGSWPANCFADLRWSQGISTFYFNDRGYMVTGWQKIDGKWYFFDEKSGAMRKGWIVWDGSWFYLNPDTGIMHTGWLEYKNRKCYLADSGRALCDCVHTIDGRVYSFDKNCYATEIKPVSDDKRDLNGADVASYQKDLRPALMTTTDFIIVKFTQGTWYVNPYAEAQYAGVKAAGKLPGVYHYGEGGDAKKEAQFFAKKLGARIGECVPGLDWEGTQNPTFGTGKDVVWCLTFCDEFYRLTGVRPVIYMSKSVCRRYDWSKVAQKYKLWCAQYASNKATDYQDSPWTDSNGFGAWDGDTIRQYSSHGHIVGYSGYIDINKAYLTKAEWLELAKPEKENKTTKATKESTEAAQTAWAPEVDQVTNPVKISNSGSDENGNYKGGKAGDQTGKEWRIRDWYNYPWSCVLRHPNAEVRKCLATLAVKAANNDNIGYDQAQRETYRKALEKAGWDPAKIEEAVESDCSAGVIANIIATGHILGIAGLQNFGATYTGNMRKEGGNRGFQVLTDPKYLNSSEYLLAGDIPLNDAHHVCTVVTNGTKSGAEVPLTDRGTYEIMPLLKRGSKGKAVKVLQALLGGLAIDGSFGPLTLNSVLLLQKRQGLLQDGEVGPLTWNAVIRTQPILKRGSKGAEVKAIQIMLGGLTIDGSYGRFTEAAVKRFQATHGLEQDGEVGPMTWAALIEGSK